jgi:hypothetical protein
MSLRQIPHSSESRESHLFGEPSDRFNVVQEQMAESRQNYGVLKELMKDEDFRMLSAKVLEVQMRLKGAP